jgi:WD40 repeat protein
LVKKPLRIYEGHEERVSSLDATANVLVSGSLDHSVRVWNIETSGLLRVLRGSGSPILLIKLLPDRLAWWSRSGTFQIWTWKGPEHVEPKLRFKIAEDPTTCNISIGEHFIAVAGNDAREVIIYDSVTGNKLEDKDVFASAQIQCMDIQRNLLFLGAGRSIEIWDIDKSACITVLGSNFKPTIKKSIVNIGATDFQLVAILSNGNLFHWPLQALVKTDKKNPKVPRHYTFETFAEVVENIEPPWKKLVLSDSRIIFGLEMKFGDVKIFSWSKTTKKEASPTSPTTGMMPSFTYQFNCRPECPQCLDIQVMEVDLK